MNLKRIIDQVISKRYSKPKQPWEGVYSHYREVPVTGEGLSGNAWMNMSRAAVEGLLHKSGADQILSNGVAEENSLLPLLVSVLAENKQQIRILDFGGGAGRDFLLLVNSWTRSHAIDYWIIESRGICEVGSSLFREEQRIHFYPSLPAELPDLDIVYINSALQYVEDYAAVLKKLTSYKPRYFLFVRLSAGEFPTYATAQKNVPGSVYAYWFLNLGQLLRIMKDEGYELLFRGFSEVELNQDNFPESHRLGRTRNLLFSKRLVNGTN